MNINPNINSMNTFQTKVSKNAHDMAVTTTGSLNDEYKINPNKDVARLLTDDMINEIAFEAQTKPIKTQDEIFGTLLDIKA